MSEVLRKSIPLGITFIIGSVFLVEWFFVIPEMRDVTRLLTDFGMTIAAAALGLGGINLLARHGGYIRKRTPKQWYNSAALIASLLLFIIVGVQQGSTGSNYQWIYNYIVVPLTSTMYASIAFFLASASYRALRARTWETTDLLVTGVILLLRNAPIGAVIWGGFPVIGDWLMDVPTAAAYRGVLMGTTLGVLALGVRTLIGMERGYLGRE